MAFAYKNLPIDRRQKYSYCEVSQISTNSAVALSGSELDCRGCRNCSYTFSVVTNAVTVQIWVANKSDFSDELSWNVANPASIAVGTNEGWSGHTTTNVPINAAFAYCRVKILSSTTDQHGTITCVGYAQ